MRRVWSGMIRVWSEMRRVSWKFSKKRLYYFDTQGCTTKGVLLKEFCGMNGNLVKHTMIGILY